MSTTRVRMSPDVRREQLIELGVRLFATRSLEDLSIETLADEAGISRGLLYHYFGGKQEFHTAVVRRAADHLFAVTAPDGEGSPLEQLAGSLARYVDYVAENYQGYVSLLRGAAGGHEGLREIYEDSRAALTERLFEGPVAEEAASLGLTDTPTVRLLVRGWAAFTEEVVLEWVRDDRGITRDELLVTLVGVAAGHPGAAAAGVARASGGGTGLGAAGEDPELHRHEAQHGDREVRGGEHDDLDTPARRARGMQQRERAGRHRQTGQEDEQPLRLVTYGVPRTAHPEGEPPVGSGVHDRRREERGEVGPPRRHRRAQPEEQRGVRQRGEDADHQEDAHLHADPAATRLGAGATEPLADLAQRQRPLDQGATQPGDADQVVERRADEVDAAVRVVGPVDGHLVDAQAGPLGDHEELGVEEPGVVLHEGEQLARRVPADGLEPALGVAEPRPQRLPQDQVVAARDELPLRPALDPRGGGEAGPDRDVGVPADQGSDEREQRREVGGQVDVHVDEDVALRGAPHPLERPAPALLRQVDHRHLGVGVAQPAGDQGGLVGAGVVGDRDLEGPGQGAQVGEHPLHRGGQLGLLVEDRDDHVDHGGDGSLGRAATGLRRLHQRAHWIPPERS